jgi:paraquat-inducible protein B
MATLTRRRARFQQIDTSPIATLKKIGVVAALGAAILGFLNVPDLVRYWRMRRM